jgi:hypothetical protein
LTLLLRYKIPTLQSTTLNIVATRSCEAPTGTTSAILPTLKEAAIMKATKKIKKTEEQGRNLVGTVALRGTPKKPSKAIPYDIYAGPSQTRPFRETLVEQLISE